MEGVRWAAIGWLPWRVGSGAARSAPLLCGVCGAELATSADCPVVSERGKWPDATCHSNQPLLHSSLV